MGMKFGLVECVLLAILLFCLAGCTSINNAATTGISYLYVTAQANTTISAYTVTQSTGALTANGNAVGTGAVPSAIAVTPSGNALFVANSGSNNISSYSINSDATLTPASATTATGTTPMGLAIDPGGKFLFVANQGSSNISVFSINGTGLTPVPGSPFTTIPVGYSFRMERCRLQSRLATRETSCMWRTSWPILFQRLRSIALQARSPPLPVPFYDDGQTSPSGLAVTPNGGFLYVANAGANSNNISA